MVLDKFWHKQYGGLTKFSKALVAIGHECEQAPIGPIGNHPAWLVILEFNGILADYAYYGGVNGYEKHARGKSRGLL